MRQSRTALRLGLVTAAVALGTLMWGIGPALAASAFNVSAHTTFDRTYTWEITKVAHNPSLTLAVGESFVETYDVKVTNTGYTDSNWKALDGIHYKSDTTFTATAVTAVVNPGGISAPVSCPSLPFTGKDLVCSYGPVALPDGSPRTVTATITFADASTASQSFSFDFTNDLLPGQPVEFDKCVDASDSYAGALGTVCVGDSPKTFTYTRQIGPYATCGDYQVENTAWLSNDTLHPVSATVNVHVPCHGTGCTLTQGYWKTHSQRGPAPYDDNWANLGPLQQDTTFFTSGYTWYSLFWTPPAGGNAYIQLAHQYMAAKLNILNGASTAAAVDAAIASAEAFFPGKTPSTVLTKAQANAARAAAGTLGSYNEGAIGPGHCDE
jgi:hypothetical protein